MYNNIYLFITLLVLTVAVNCQQQWPVNRHYYQSFPADTLSSAIIECGKKTYPIGGAKGYLVTFTSLDEFNFLISKGMITSSTYLFWISGSDAGGTQGIWTYRSGPENGQLMYSIYNDRVYQFSKFASTEPNLLQDENGIELTYDALNGFSYNNNNPTISRQYICEFGGLEQPYMTSVDTSGGTVTVTFPVAGYNLNTVTMTFTNYDNPTTTFTCSNPLVTSSTTLTCTVPPGSGRYNLVFASGATNDTVYWTYNAPYVGFISPAFVSGQTVTIVGNSFGTDTSKITVLLGNQNHVCNNIQFITTVADQAFTCILQNSFVTTNSQDKLLPISINVNGLTILQYRPPIYYAPYKLYYYLWRSLVTFSAGRSQFAPLTKADGFSGRLGIIDSKPVYDFLYQSYAPLSTSYLTCWQGFVYVGGKYLIIDGPKSGQQTNIYSTSSITNTSSSLYYSRMDNGNVISTTSTTEVQGVLFEFGGDSPAFLNNQTQTIDTTGGLILLNLNNYGGLFSTTSMTINGSPATFTRTSVRGVVSLLIPAGSGGPYTIGFTADGKGTPANTQFILYNKPNLTSIVSSPPTQGGTIILNGFNFYTDPSLIQVVANGLPCTNVQIVTAHTSISCIIAPGSGLTTVSVTVSGQTSVVPLSISYQKPVVANATSLSPLGGSLTINGLNFYTNPSLITISISNPTNPQISCYDVQVTIPHLQLICSLPPQQGQYNLSLTVNTLPLIPTFLFGYNSAIINNVIQTDDYLEIYGDNFGNNLSYLNLTLGTVLLSNSPGTCLGNNTYVVCDPIPFGAISGLMFVNGSAQVTPPYPFYFTPYLVSITNVLIPTQGMGVGLTGRFFELNVFGASNNLSVVDNGFVNTNTGWSTNSKLNYQILPGTGLNHELYIQAGGSSPFRVSSPKLYSFQPPQITGYNQTVDTITLVGKNFGNNTSKISINVGGLKGTNIAIPKAHLEISFTVQNRSLNGELMMNVDGQLVIYSEILLKPVIINVTLPSVDGDTVTVSGKYLSNINQDGENSSIMFYFNNNASSCSYVNMVGGLYTYYCFINNGSGVINGYVINEGVQSDPYLFSYQPPSVTGSTSLTYQVGGYITITGNNFIDKGLNVTIGGSKTCFNPTLKNSQTIICYYDATLSTNSTLVVTVVVDGLTTSAPVFSYTSIIVSNVVQINDYIVITGSGFGQVSLLNVSINQVLLACTGNSTLITCDPLPVQVESGPLYISNGLWTVSPTTILFNPYLLGMDTYLFDTVGGNVTITGRFFEQTSDGVANIISIINNHQPPISGDTLTYVDNGTLVYSIPVGTGKQLTLEVLVGNRSSNHLLYSYLPPNATSYSQSGSTLQIHGRYFGASATDIAIHFENQQPFNPSLVQDNLVEFELDNDSKNGPLYVNVSGQATVPMSIQLVPYLTNIFPTVPTSGGILSIYGSYLSNVDSRFDPVPIKFAYSLNGSGLNTDLTCQYQSTSYPYLITCQQPTGYGYYTVYAYYSTIYSNGYITSYTPPIVVSATSLVYNQAGQVVIGGSSFSSQSLTVFIGGIECTEPRLLDANNIQCQFSATAAPDPTGEGLFVNVTTASLTGANQVFLYYRNRPCPVSSGVICSGHGTCNELLGYCACVTQYSGDDCSIPVNEFTPTVPPPYTNITTGKAIVYSGYPFQYDTHLAYLRELAGNGSTVQLLPLSSIVWINRQPLGLHTSYFKGIFENNTAVVEMNVTFIEQSTFYEFAGDSIPIPPNAVKYQVQVSQWSFQDPLNHLQVIFRVSVPPTTDYLCQITTTNYVTNSNTSLDDSITNVQIQTGPSILTCKYSDRTLVDSKAMKSKVVVLASSDPIYNLVVDSNFNLFTAITIPSFQNDTVVDPAFSSTPRPNYDYNCQTNGNDGESSKDKWKIPVIIAASCLGGAIAIVGAAYVFKKKVINNDKVKGWKFNRTYRPEYPQEMTNVDNSRI